MKYLFLALLDYSNDYCALKCPTTRVDRACTSTYKSDSLVNQSLYFILTTNIIKVIKIL